MEGSDVEWLHCVGQAPCQHGIHVHTTWEEGRRGERGGRGKGEERGGGGKGEERGGVGKGGERRGGIGKHKLQCSSVYHITSTDKWRAGHFLTCTMDTK